MSHTRGAGRGGEREGENGVIAVLEQPRPRYIQPCTEEYGWHSARGRPTYHQQINKKSVSAPNNDRKS